MGSRGALSQLEEFARVVRQIRGDLTQVEMARILQPDADHGSRVSGWENSGRYPELVALAKILEHFGYSWQHFGELLDLSADEMRRRQAIQDSIRPLPREDAQKRLESQKEEAIRVAQEGGLDEGSSENGA